MSTVDSGMHSISTSLVKDIYEKLRSNTDDITRLKMARFFTIAAGVLGTLSAVLISKQDAKSLWDLLLLLMALFGSTLAGVFLLGVFTKRAHSLGVIIGIVSSGGTLIIIKNVENSPFHGVLTAAAGVITCVVVGYIASLLLPSTSRPLGGLTWNTLGEEEASS